MAIHGSWRTGHQAPDLRGIGAERRGGTFRYYLPPRLAAADVGAHLSRAVREEALEVSAAITTTSVQIDEPTRASLFPLLLRSESIASSEIERIRASPRDVSYAQLGAPLAHLRNVDALSVARNVEATCAAIQQLAALESWAVADLEQVHGVLGVRSGLRTVDVWIGGRDRVCADYVAPPAEEVRPLVEDLLAVADRSGEHPLLLAALVHAQFETIHPFEDGNGRAGRALVHAILERGGVVRSGLLPISTVLRHRQSEYVRRLTATRTDDPDEALAALEAWVEFFTDVAAEAGEALHRRGEQVRALDALLEEKARGLRANSSARRALPLLREQPVLTAAFLAERLGVSRVAAHGAIESLVTRGILTPGTGRYRRSEVFQANDVLAVIDAAV